MTEDNKAARYSILLRAIRQIAGSGDGTGCNPQLMVAIAKAALASEGKANDPL